MKYKIRTAVPTDEGKIRELFLEMLRTIYHTDDVKGYGDGDLDRVWSESPDRIYVAEDGQVVAFLSVEVHHVRTGQKQEQPEEQTEIHRVNAEYRPMMLCGG